MPLPSPPWRWVSHWPQASCQAARRPACSRCCPPRNWSKTRWTRRCCAPFPCASCPAWSCRKAYRNAAAQSASCPPYWPRPRTAKPSRADSKSSAWPLVSAAESCASASSPTCQSPGMSTRAQTTLLSKPQSEQLTDSTRNTAAASIFSSGRDARPGATASGAAMSASAARCWPWPHSAPDARASWRCSPVMKRLSPAPDI